LAEPVDRESSSSKNTTNNNFIRTQFLHGGRGFMRWKFFAVVGFFLGLNLTFAGLLQSKDGGSFTAPNVNGDANLGNPVAGDIVYDTSTSGFFGYASGSWVLLGATANPNHAPTVQKFTSGSGVYTTPAGVLYIHVEMAGGGGGGAGSGTTGGTGGTGGNTTFGSSFLTCNGGAGGAGSNTPGNATGGTATGNGNGHAIQGGAGGAGSSVLSYAQSAPGGSNPLGGAGAITVDAATGVSGAANTGAGGAGGGTATDSASANGGGAGGYIKTVVNSPSSTYSYSVGAGGSGGTAGGTGAAGGAGGSGVIIVEEYYQ
jgi:hypothetical protein